MFKTKPPAEPTDLDKAIAYVHQYMSDLPPDSDEYAKTTAQLVKLYSLKKETPSMRVSADTLVTVGGNLLGILVIVVYESRNVLTSKALGFIGKAVR